MSDTVKKWAKPPIEKVYEAFSAIADDRVEIFEDHATVLSSDGKKEYLIEWSGDWYSSNDNASYFQGYMGYPVIAVLMLRGAISYDEVLVSYMKNIPWKELNTKHRRNYALVVDIVLSNLQAWGIDIIDIKHEAENVYEQVCGLDIVYKRSKLKPPYIVSL